MQSMGVVLEQLPEEPLRFLLGCLQNMLQVSAMKPVYMNRKITEQVKEENILQTCFAQSTSKDIAQEQQISVSEDTETVNSCNPFVIKLANAMSEHRASILSY